MAMDYGISRKPFTKLKLIVVLDVLGVLLQVLQGEHFVFEVRDNASLDGIGVG